MSPPPKKKLFNSCPSSFLTVIALISLLHALFYYTDAMILKTSCFIPCFLIGPKIFIDFPISSPIISATEVATLFKIC